MKHLSIAILALAVAVYASGRDVGAEEEEETAQDRWARAQLEQLVGNTQVLFRLSEDIQQMDANLLQLHETLALSQGRVVDDKMMADIRARIAASRQDLGRRRSERQAAHDAFARVRDRILEGE